MGAEIHLNNFCEILGWQGGTIYQVFDEVRRLKRIETVYLSHIEKLRKDVDSLLVQESGVNALLRLKAYCRTILCEKCLFYADYNRCYFTRVLPSDYDDIYISLKFSEMKQIKNG